MKLFNCEYRDGRASSAPELRKGIAKPEAHMTHDESDANNQSPQHDPDVLPHNYRQCDLDETCPKAVVPDDGDCGPTSRCICGRPDCEVCFPPRLPEFSPPIVNSEAWLTMKSVYPRRLRELDEDAPSQHPMSRVAAPAEP